MHRILLILQIAVVLCCSTAFADEENDEVTAEREMAFQQQMANVVMVGSFTVDGKSDDEPLKEERYEIDSVSHLGSNLWIFTARIKYGNIDTKLPITVPVEWAGDTPMVSLTNQTLPGLGEAFSARVIFYENRYAGTWQHGTVGGHMFGRIEKKPTEEKKPADAPGKEQQKPEPKAVQPAPASDK